MTTGALAAVITCSNRSASGERGDESGEALAALLTGDGHSVVYRVIVRDDIEAIRTSIKEALAAGARIVITTGGTGPTPTDMTPEAVQPLLDKEIPGIAETLRSASRDKVPTSILSRGVAGIIGDAVVVTLPGSPGGVRDGMKVLSPLLSHLLEQVLGSDHRPGGGV
jgi:molybdenum cofactor synthesis domain-containing protein